MGRTSGGKSQSAGTDPGGRVNASRDALDTTIMEASTMIEDLRKHGKESQAAAVISDLLEQVQKLDALCCEQQGHIARLQALLYGARQ